MADVPMQCDIDLDWCTYRCPCGDSLCTRYASDKTIAEWKFKHRPHTNGKCLDHTTESGNRVWGSPQPDVTSNLLSEKEEARYLESCPRPEAVVQTAAKDKMVYDVEECRQALDPIFMKHGTEVGLHAVAKWLTNSDLSAAGHTGRMIAQLIDVMAQWEW